MVDWQSESDLDSARNSCDVSNPRMLFFTEPPPEKMSMAYLLPNIPLSESESDSDIPSLGTRVWFLEIE